MLINNMIIAVHEISWYLPKITWISFQIEKVKFSIESYGLSCSTVWTLESGRRRWGTPLALKEPRQPGMVEDFWNLVWMLNLIPFLWGLHELCFGSGSTSFCVFSSLESHFGSPKYSGCGSRHPKEKNHALSIRNLRT